MGDKRSAAIDEAEANAFALELLMPLAWLRRDLKGLDFDLAGDDVELRKMAKRYGVSMTALVHRLTTTRLIGQNREKSADG